MRVRSVPKKDLPAISGAGWIDPKHRPFIDGESAWVPVRDGEPFDREIGRSPRYSGRGYFMIGDIVVFHGLRPSPDDVQKIVALKHPVGVIWREALDDITRTPRVVVLYGSCGETRHRESGYVYHLDPSKVMFSQGNRGEKERIAKLIRERGGGERVADMFAGIGYFTIPAAGAGAAVHAMEINPVSCQYLRKNAAANQLADRITITEGDCRESLSGTDDRNLRGHFDAPSMLPHALGHVRPGSVIHLSSLGTDESVIRECVESAGFSCGIQTHKVKKYRPYTWHLVHDITIP